MTQQVEITYNGGWKHLLDIKFSASMTNFLLVVLALMLSFIALGIFYDLEKIETLLKNQNDILTYISIQNEG